MEELDNKKIYKTYPSNYSAFFLNIISILIILLSIAVIIGTNYYQQNNIPIKSNLINYQEPTIQPDINSAIISIADQTVSWIKSKKSLNGKYYLKESCNLQKNNCQNTSEDSRIATSVLWSHFIHYQVTKDSKDIDNIDTIINHYNSPESVGIQNNFWACKRFWVMWESDTLNNSLKEKLKNLCLYITFYRPYAEDILKNDPDINKTSILELSETVPDLYYRSYDQNSNYEDNQLINLSAFASDFVYRYKFTQDHKNIDNAETYFKAAINQLNQVPKNNYINGRCILGIAALDLYSTNKNNDYLKFAQNFAKNQSLDNYAKFINKPNSNIPTYFQNSIFEKASCGLFYKYLYDQTNNQFYKNYSFNLLTNMLNTSKDDTAFYSLSNSGYFYSVKENSLVLENLANNIK